MSHRCECGHHRMSHSYTRDGNVGRCLSRSGDQQLVWCDCKEFKPADTEEES